jgi:hypothetical protein
LGYIPRRWEVHQRTEEVEKEIIMEKNDRRKDKTDILKKTTIEALEKSLGIVTTACKAVGIHRSTYYEWYNTDPEFKESADELLNVALDFAESSLHNQIKAQIPSSTIFYLKTKGRGRGYIEQMNISDVTPADVKESSDEVILTRIRKMAKLLLDGKE